MRTLVVLAALGLFVALSAAAGGINFVTIGEYEKLAKKKDLIVALVVKGEEPKHIPSSERLVMMLNQVKQRTDQAKLNVAYVKMSAEVFYMVFSNAIEVIYYSDMPGIVAIRDGNARSFRGQRMPQVLLDYVTSLATQPAVVSIGSKASKQAFLKAPIAVKVVGYFSSFEDNPAYDTYKKLARAHQLDQVFGATTDAKVAKSFKLKRNGQIALIKPNEKTTIYEEDGGELTFDDLSSWFVSSKRSLWVLLTKFNTFGFWERNVASLLLFTDSKQVSAHQKAFSAFKAIAKQKIEGINCVLVDSAHYDEFIFSVGIVSSQMPVFGLLDPMGGEEYFFPSDQKKITSANLKSWIQGYKDKTLEKNLFSFVDAVEVLTEENYEENVVENTKDVLVYHYDMNTTEAVRAAPLMKQLALVINRVNKNVIVTATQDEELKTKHGVIYFPTIVLLSNEDKTTPIKYEGELQLEPIVQFLRENLESETASKKEEL